jgi:hypothetical protein
LNSFLLVVYLQVGGLDDVTGVLLPPVQLVKQVDETPAHQARRQLSYTVKIVNGKISNLFYGVDTAA